MCRLIIALLMCLASVPCVQTQVVGGVPHPPGEGRIAGRILNDSGEPLPGVAVTLLMFTVDPPEAASFRWSTKTAGDGSYEFAHLPAGRLRIAAEKSGYTLLRVHENGFESDHRDVDLEASGSQNGIDLVMHRTGSITGRITDENGHPKAGASVQATIRFADGKFVGTRAPAETDADGHYRLEDIPPGSYFVRVSGATVNSGRGGPVPFERREYADTFHPNAVDADRATQVAVRPDVHLDGVDIELRTEQRYGIAGRITDASGVVPQNLRLEHAELSGRSAGVFMGFRNGEGRFSLGGVPPGRVALLVRGDLEGATVVGSEIVEVHDASLTDVHIIVGGPARIAGRVIVEGGTLADVSPIVVAAAPPWHRVPVRGEDPDSATVDASGRFGIDGLLGERRIVAPRLPVPWIIKEVRRGGRVVEGGRVTLVAGEAVEDLEIIVARHPIR